MSTQDDTPLWAKIVGGFGLVFICSILAFWTWKLWRMFP